MKYVYWRGNVRLWKRTAYYLIGELLSKIYIAARYSRYPEMWQVAERLTAMGHVVTSRWVQGAHQCNDDQLMNAEAWAIQIADDDLEDLDKSDTLVLFTDPLRTATRGGKQFEAGYAFHSGMKLYLVGTPEHVFQHRPEWTRVANVHFLYALLEPGYWHASWGCWSGKSEPRT